MISAPRLASGRRSSAVVGRERIWATVLVALVAAIVTSALRLLALVGFPNDQFVSLSRAAQVLLGDWPIRDFVEPGAPLTTLVAAAAQAIGGRTLLSEAVFVAAAFGAAAALTVVVVRAWSGSLVLASWAAVTEVVAFPRPYGYPKILLYVAAAGAILLYAGQPTRRRLALAAVLVAIAMLFRHDHGVYIGVAVAVAVAARHASSGPRTTVRECAVYVLLVAALLAPYLAYVQAYSSVGEYLATGAAVSRVEAARTRLGWPDPTGIALGDPDQVAAILFYVFWAVVIAAGVTWATVARTREAADSSIAAGVVILGVCVNTGFLRDPLAGRIADAIVPVVLLLAWLSVAAVERARRHRVAATVVAIVLALTTAAAARVGRIGEQLNRTGIEDGAAGLQRRIRAVTAELRQRYAERQMPTDFAFALVPFYQYVQVCTPGDARLLVTGFAPEIPYYARRGFAGGVATLYGGFDATPRDQQRIVSRVERQLVPFAIVPPDRSAELRRLYPEVAAYLDRHYRPLADVPVEGFAEPGHILVRTALEPVGTYGPSGWPCFR